MSPSVAPSPAGLHTVRHGSGTPVVAIHGMACDHRLMTAFVEPLFAQREGYRRTYPDLPGMGESSGEGIRSTADLLDRLMSWLDEEVGDEPFVLVGESYGGRLARAITDLRGEQVLGLALVCPAVGDKDDRVLPPRQKLIVEPGLPERIEGMTGAEEFLNDMAVVATDHTWTRYAYEVAPGVAAAPTRTVAHLEDKPELAVEDGERPAYDGPTCVITGRQDSVTGYVDAFAALEQYPRASFAVLDLAGHNAQIEQPDLVHALLSNWLDRVELSRSAEGA